MKLEPYRGPWDEPIQYDPSKYMNNKASWFKCPSCLFSGEHEIVFESITPNIEAINFCCPNCGCATTHGKRINNEEFYY